MEQDQARADHGAGAHLPEQPSELGGDLAARVESAVQHARHTHARHERHGRLVHEGARHRAEHSLGAHPRRLAGPQGALHTAQRPAALVQHRPGVPGRPTRLPQARQVDVRSHPRSRRRRPSLFSYVVLLAATCS